MVVCADSVGPCLRTKTSSGLNQRRRWLGKRFPANVVMYLTREALRRGDDARRASSAAPGGTHSKDLVLEGGRTPFLVLRTSGPRSSATSSQPRRRRGGERQQQNGMPGGTSGCLPPEFQGGGPGAASASTSPHRRDALVRASQSRGRDPNSSRGQLRIPRRRARSKR